MDMFRKILNITLQHEGGYVNDPSDSGGATRCGITERVARQYDYQGPMSELPFDLVCYIYEMEYWKKIKGDTLVKTLNLSLAAQAVFDFGVNAGVRTAVRTLQTALNAFNRGHLDTPLFRELVIDGDLGDRTMSSMFKLCEYRGVKPVDETLFTCVQHLRGQAFILEATEWHRDKHKKFIWGWMQRMQQQNITNIKKELGL